MCDTFGIGAEMAGSGISIFAKNSDREADEAQLVISVPPQCHPEGDTLQCTHTAIPQVRSTYALVLSKPFWLWGAEMGVNEKGVAIGNEALFTKVKPEKKPGLIGMDLLRLALERGATAEEAAQIISELLRQYGQAGSCGYRDKKLSYMNSYIIMDRQAIIKLETAGRDHVLKRYNHYAVISNAITLTNDWDASSLPPGTDFSKLSDPLMTYFAGGAFRRDRNQDCIAGAKEGLGVTDVFAMLRSHYADSPATGFNRDVCMHASDPLIRRSQTTGSMVVELHPDDKFRIFVTGGSAPCLTVFKPFLPALPFKDLSFGGGSYADDSYWWRHEAYHVNAVLRYETVRPLAQDRIAESEAQWTAYFPAHAWDSTDPLLIEMSHDAFMESESREKTLMAQMKGMKQSAGGLSPSFWKRVARRCGVPMV